VPQERPDAVNEALLTSSRMSPPLTETSCGLAMGRGDQSMSAISETVKAAECAAI